MSISQEIRDHLISEAPGRAVLAALEKLIECDAYLLINDANERSLSHRFALYLQAELPTYHVDCEYNRNNADPKRIKCIHSKADCTVSHDLFDTDAKTVYPDVIAHIRGNRQNYLVVEFKKSTSNRKDSKFDLEKLRVYKSDAKLKYQYALFIELGVKENAGVSKAEWV